MDELFGSYIFTIFLLQIGYCIVFVFDENPLPYTPKNVYERSQFNYPTCVVLAICVWIMFPICTVWHFINWIMHVGR